MFVLFVCLTPEQEGLLWRFLIPISRLGGTFDVSLATAVPKKDPRYGDLAPDVQTDWIVISSRNSPSLENFGTTQVGTNSLYLTETRVRSKTTTKNMIHKMTSLTFSRLLICALAGWMAFTGLIGDLRADTVVPPRKPAVLFSGWTTAQISSDIANRLAREGFAIRTTPPASDPPKPLTWDCLLYTSEVFSPDCRQACDRDRGRA